MSSEHVPAPDPLAAVAARWVERRDAGLTPGEQQALRAWLAADRRHAAAFAAADARWSELDWPVQTGTAGRVLAGLHERAARRRVRRRRVAAAAAALAFLIAGGTSARLLLHNPAGPSNFVVQAPLRETLPDGSFVERPPGVKLEIAFTDTERRVVLSSGSAHFEVRKDPDRPFLVTTDTIVARAVGTAFVVAAGSDRVTVIVTEGTVAIDRPVPAAAGDTADQTLALVEAGASVAVSPAKDETQGPEVETVEVPSGDERLAWRTPRLEFQNTRLGEVVATINRYNATQLVFADDALKRLRISGALRTDRIDALLEMLETDFEIRTSHEATEIILHPRGR